ncbi:MAG: class I SAM-dependent methyltransferase [Firmicutes bacterium]|jgi:ubiquinone/menaquinone biosynthesis C-methylase UbiE|nr:class I SAM-dependent methyltransferase [Bacillota bacterium]
MKFTVDMLETEARMAELIPTETLKYVGFEDGMIFCDIGAGSGIFSFPAAEISSNTVYALELNDDLIGFMDKKKSELGLDHMQIKKVNSENLPVNDDSCDVVMMTAVLHGIKRKVDLIKEIKRVLRSQGKLVIVEFHKKDQVAGPPLEYRMSPLEVKDIIEKCDFELEKERVLGENNYLLSFKVKS